MVNTSTSFPVYGVVCDLDRCIVDNKVETIEDLAFFQSQGYVVSALKTHIIFPGVIEFLKLLFKENIEVSFFSAGHVSRNLPLVDQLLKLACTEEEYPLLSKKTCILSRDETSSDLSTEEIKSNILRFRPLFFSGYSENDIQKYLIKQSFAKNLANVISQVDIRNRILVDDDPSNIGLDQFNHFLCVPPIAGTDFNFLSSARAYTEVTWLEKATDFSNEMIKKNLFSVFVVKESLSVCYLNHLNQIFTKTLTERENPFLVEAIRTFAQKTEVEQKKAEESLLKAAQTWNEYPFNRIYAVAGMVFKAIENARKENAFLSDSLYDLQFDADGTYKKPFASHTYYALGFKKLKEINPKLEWVNEESFAIHSTTTPKNAPQDYLEKLQDLYDNQFHLKPDIP